VVPIFGGYYWFTFGALLNGDYYYRPDFLNCSKLLVIFGRREGY